MIERVRKMIDAVDIQVVNHKRLARDAFRLAWRVFLSGIQYLFRLPVVHINIRGIRLVNQGLAIYALWGTDDGYGIFRSFDMGISWAKFRDVPTGVGDPIALAVVGEIVIVGYTDGSVCRSMGKESWFHTEMPAVTGHMMGYDIVFREESIDDSS